ncbi:MAG: four helix bundle protein [Candidatus Ratteibacteria bacterium]|nr:four helix bundle protein [Candidatus Ratteibacteria bacterium]
MVAEKIKTIQSAPYEKLKFYQNICEIRRLISKITKRLEKTHLRLVSQMRDAARSAKQNIREGYRKDTAGEFSHSIKISAGSLGELEGDIDDCREDELINKEEHAKLKNLFSLTNYQIDRYLDSLYKLDKNGQWKSRFKK